MGGAVQPPNTLCRKDEEAAMVHMYGPLCWLVVGGWWLLGRVDLCIKHVPGMHTMHSMILNSIGGNITDFELANPGCYCQKCIHLRISGYALHVKTSESCFR